MMDRTELKKIILLAQNLKQVPTNMKYGLQDMQRVSGTPFIDI